MALATPLRHRVLPRWRVSAGDEDGGHLVPRATRPRGRHGRRRAHRREGDAVSRARGSGSGRDGVVLTASARGAAGGAAGVRRATTMGPYQFPPRRSRGDSWARWSRERRSGGSPPAATSATWSSCTRSGPGSPPSLPRASRRRSQRRRRVGAFGDGGIAAGVRHHRRRRRRMHLGRAVGGPRRARAARHDRDGGERHLRAARRAHLRALAAGCSRRSRWRGVSS